MAKLVQPGLRWLLVAASLPAMLAVVAVAQAQVFGPPSTIFGSVTDSAGPVPEGLPVEAYIGDKVCGKGKTGYTCEGNARVTVYFADVVSKEQTAGCGFDNAEVRIKIGDRFATKTAKWAAGPVQLDVTFGDATPAPIPTFTPAPNRPAAVQTNEAGTPIPGSNTPVGTIPAGSPGAGSPIPTIKGGITSNTNNTSSGGGDGGGGGFPIWAAVILALGGIAVAGGGVGFIMARNRRAEAESDRDVFVPGPRPPSDS